MSVFPYFIHKRKLAVVALAFFICPAPAQKAAQQSAYLDPSLSVARRVDDLVSRMTLAEKISQMQNEAPAIPRLHIAAYDWWNEGLHGVARSGYATVFPAGHRPGCHLGHRARASRGQCDLNRGARQVQPGPARGQSLPSSHGLTLWSPNINIFRDPRWGRGQET